MFRKIVTSLPLMGIPREYFTQPFRGIIPSTTLYKEQSILKLVKYDTKSHIYTYEDENIYFWDPTTPTEKSGLFFILNRKDQIESKHGQMFFSTVLDRDDCDITSVCFEFFPANDSSVSYQGVLLIPHCLSGMLERMQAQKKEGYLFIAPQDPLYFLFVQAITKKAILEIMEYLSAQNPGYLKRILLQVKK